MDQAEKDKLLILLDYWVKHNREHGEEFKEWAEKAKNYGEPAVHDELMEAVEQMAKPATDNDQAAAFEPDILAFCCEH